MASKKSSKKKTPWEKPAPRKASHTTLTSAQKKHAAARAKKAGRSYPNLVDNMHEAQASGGTGKKATTRKGAAKKKTTSKRAPAKKTTSKRAPAKKKAAKRAPAKKTTSKRAPAKKTTSKRAPAKKKAAKRAPAKRKKAAAYTARKPSAKHPVEKDPKGGLTAAGRRAFHERDGSNLKPGVTKPLSQMSVEDMKRKGSWAVRFYGRKKLPPLLDKAGKPTRLALTAAAWGEPVPKTEEQARKIADKGHRLLERAKKAQA